MPKRGRSRRPRRGRSLHRRKRAINERVPKLTIGGQIVPDKLLVSLPYFVSDTVVTTGAAAFAKVFQSAAFDPEYAVGGHQPLGYDQWALFYQNCRVYGVTGTVKFCNQTAIPWYVSLLYTDDITTIPAVASNALFEQPGVKPKLVGITTGGHDVVTLRVHWSPKQLLGLTTGQYKDEIGTAGTMSSLGGSVPAINSFMAGVGWTVTGALSAGAEMICMYDLVYHCELFGRRPLPTS